MKLLITTEGLGPSAANEARLRGRVENFLFHPLDIHFLPLPPLFFHRKNNPGEVVIQSENGERRILRSTPDWTDEAVNAEHVWMPTSASGDLCYVSTDHECNVSPLAVAVTC